MIFFKKISKKRRLFFQFSKYTAVGISATILNIFFMWLLIDMLSLNVVLSTAIIIITLFFVKFYAYAAINLIHKHIYKFLFINIISAALNWFFAWFFIEIIGLSAAVSASIVVTSLFILRFILFKGVGLVK